MFNPVLMLVAVAITVCTRGTYAEETMSLEQAAKKSNNPVSDAWRLISQSENTRLDTPEGEKWQHSVTIQPVLPVPLALHQKIQKVVV